MCPFRERPHVHGGASRLVQAGAFDVAVPKRRKSPSRKGMRRSHDYLTPINLTICPMCKQPVPTHRVHEECLMEHIKNGPPGRMPR